MELRVFLLEHAHVFEHGVGVCSKGQQDPVGQDRFQKWKNAVGGRSKDLSRFCVRNPCDSDHHAGFRLL